MKTSHLAASIGFLALSLAFASPAKAECGSPTPGVFRVKPVGAYAPRSTDAAGFRSIAFAPAAPDHDGGGGSIVGLWMSNYTIDGQPFFQAFEAFDDDGLEILNDNGSPSAGNVCLGVWTERPKNVIKVKHPSWSYDDQGVANGIVVIEQEIKVDGRGNKFTGKFTIDVFDNNAVLLQHFGGDVSATRITAD